MIRKVIITRDNFSAMIVFMLFYFLMDYYFGFSGGHGMLHLHALIVSLLRLLLLLLLFVVFRSGLPFLQRLFQVLGRLVGLALAVHRHLCAALVGRGDLLRVVGVGVVAVRTSLLRVELDVHRGVEALLVGHVLQFDGFACRVIGFLLVGEVHTAPFADGADATISVRPRVAALLFLWGCGIFHALRPVSYTHLTLPTN